MIKGRLTLYRGFNDKHKYVYWETKVPICCGGISIVYDRDNKWKMIAQKYDQPKTLLSHESMEELVKLYRNMSGIELEFDNTHVWSRRKAQRNVCHHIGMNKRQKLVPAREERWHGIRLH